MYVSLRVLRMDLVQSILDAGQTRRIEFFIHGACGSGSGAAFSLIPDRTNVALRGFSFATATLGIGCHRTADGVSSLNIHACLRTNNGKIIRLPRR